MVIMENGIFMLDVEENSQYSVYVLITNNIGTTQFTSVPICKYDSWMNGLLTLVCLSSHF